MIMHIKHVRSDYNIAVTYCYDNGVRLNKIVSLRQAIESAKQADFVYNRQLLQKTLDYLKGEEQIGNRGE